jgi:hypothetical protein
MKTIKRQYTTPETVFQSLRVVELIMASKNWDNPNASEEESDWGDW